MDRGSLSLCVKALALALPLLPLCMGVSPVTTTLCNPGAFTFPKLFGAELIGIEANEVRNYTLLALSPGNSFYLVDSYTVNICNVTVAYTHPGWDDVLRVYAWLPIDNWNGKLQAVGGGGYMASVGEVLRGHAVANGYAVIDADAGRPLSGGDDPASWALKSPGNVNLYLLEDLAYRALGDMTKIGKSIVETYYARPPAFTYFVGCSQGGRQGLSIAQRFPEEYDGILAAAPAAHWENLFPANYWGRQLMQTLNHFPSKCEMDGFTQAAIRICDSIDGVVDGIISNPRCCDFNAHDVVGQTVPCGNSTVMLTAEGADIAQGVWDGPHNTAGNVGWFGASKDTQISHSFAATVCDQDQKTCKPLTDDLFADWIRYWVAQDPDFDFRAMDEDGYFHNFQLSDRMYTSIMGTANPDLSRLRNSGGKMITWHGIADELIPIAGNIAYYQQVLKYDPAAPDFHRFYEAPGVMHCGQGVGPVPEKAFEQLVAWVEQGVAPDTLTANSPLGTIRPLCPYPSEQKYIGGDPSKPESFTCSLRTVDELLAEPLLADEHSFYFPS